MCNLSDYVEEYGIEKGITQVVTKLIRSGKLTDEEIIEAAGITKEQLEDIKKEMLALV